MDGEFLSRSIWLTKLFVSPLASARSRRVMSSCRRRFLMRAPMLLLSGGGPAPPSPSCQSGALRSCRS